MRKRRRTRRWPRLLAGFVFELVSTVAVLGVFGAWLYAHMDLARLASAQANAATGRSVTIGSVKLALGRTITVDLSDAVLPNLPGGSAPQMVTLKHMVAEADLQSLLHGSVLLHHLEIDGLSVLLERVDGAPNWHFGAKGMAPTDPTGRTGFPSLRDVRIGASQVVFRTASGTRLVAALGRVAVATGADDQPVKFAATVTYQGVPMELDGDLQSIDALRDRTRPYGTQLGLRSGTMAVRFDGSMTDPLHIDGASGRLDLDAPDPKPLFAIAGVGSGLDAALHLEGAFDHDDRHWRLRDATGQLGQDGVDKATIDFEEGPHGQPDHLGLDLVFKGLNLDELGGSGPAGKRPGADMPLQVEENPETLIDARIASGSVDYAGIHAEDVKLAAAQTPGLITVDAFSLKTFGTELTVTGRIEAAAAGAHVTAAVSAKGAEVQTLRRELGFGALPLAGKLDAEVAVESTAPTLNTASHDARVSAVIGMRGGAIQKNVIEMASADIRSLFRTDRGMTPVTCLLAGLDMRAGAGTVAPLRVRAGEGTISGFATFDLHRRTVDLTIGSEAKSTGLFALDIPIRVTGPFGAPIISPAQWSAQGRAMLAAADTLSQLPPALRDWARRYPCPPSR